MGKFEDLTNRQFGCLTVIGIDDEKYKITKRIHWKCKCNCGSNNIISVQTSDLKSGKTSSCGCKRIEKIREIRKKYNKYDMSRDYGIGYTTNTNEAFYFDKEDYDKIKDFTWRKTVNGYIESRNKYRFITLHSLIMPHDNEHVIDHINHNRLDNRKSNLRICTQQENIFNTMRTPGKNSNHIGVTQAPSSKWVARIKKDNKGIYLGSYEKYEDAVKAREEAEIKYFKEFRYKGDN